MTNVTIHGKLGKIFGQHHRFKVKRITDIIRAINCNRPGFKNKVLSDFKSGIDYYFVDPKNPNEKYKRPEEFLDKTPEEEIHIVPCIIGSGPVGMIVVGTILKTLVVKGLITGIAGQIVGSLAVALIIQGVMALIFPVKGPENPIQKPESAIDTSSYIFSSLQNNAVQGFPIPLLYGELRVGSSIISTNVVSEDLG